MFCFENCPLGVEKLTMLSVPIPWVSQDSIAEEGTTEHDELQSLHGLFRQWIQWCCPFGDHSARLVLSEDRHGVQWPSYFSTSFMQWLETPSGWERHASSLFSALLPFFASIFPQLVCHCVPFWTTWDEIRQAIETLVSLTTSSTSSKKDVFGRDSQAAGRRFWTAG